MAYGGCVPILNTMTELLEKAGACLKYTPKVQLTKAQSRLQCNMLGSNFRKLVKSKKASGKAVFSRNFTFLFRPIMGPTYAKNQSGGSGDYEKWLDDNNAIESEKHFFF